MAVDSTGPRIVKALRFAEGVDGFYNEGAQSAEASAGTSEGLVLDGLGAVNLFVGANNAGKSRLMRAMLSSKEWWVLGDWLGMPQHARVLWAFLEVVGTDTVHRQLADFAPVGKALRGALTEPILRVNALPWLKINADWRKLLGIPFDALASDPIRRDFLNGFIQEKCKIHRNFLPDLAEAVNTIRTNLDKLNSTESRSYYPILRGLRPLVRDLNSVANCWSYTDLYQNVTRQTYAQQTGQASIHTGLSLYAEVRQRLLGGREARDHLRTYERFLSDRFFDGRPVALVPHESSLDQRNDVNQGLLHIDIDGVEHPIHHLGDGLQQLILLTWQPFFDQVENKPSVYFIEEPELYLHPGMQRRLLSFYLEETSHLYFATTHSNHLLDMSMDWDGVAVYNFWGHRQDQQPRFRVWRVDRGDQSSLQLLGVRASSVFLVNATLWVEGVTDRKYLRQFFKMLVEHLTQKKVPGPIMEEDTHYAFVEYGGANITHWSFSDGAESDENITVRRLCGRAFVLADTDTEGTKTARKEKLRAVLGDRYMETCGREVENMLPEETVRAVVGKMLGARSGSGDQREPSKVPEFKRDDYRKEYLGRWIDERLQETGVQKTAFFANSPPSSGTIKDKVRFCDFAVEHLREQKNLTVLGPDVRKLILTMYNHVRRYNGLEPLSLDIVDASEDQR